MGPNVTSLITAVVVGLLGLLIWLAQRGQPRADPHAGTLVFSHGLLVRGLAVVLAFGVPLGITAVVVLLPPDDPVAYWPIFGLYGLFLLVGATLLWEAMRYALTASSQGLDCRSPWRGGRFLTWDEIQEVSYSTLSSWFVIQAKDSWKFRVSILVPGLSQFLEQCERYLPPSALRKAETGYGIVRRPFPKSR